MRSSGKAYILHTSLVEMLIIVNSNLVADKYISNEMNKVTIFLRQAYQSPNNRPRWSLFILHELSNVSRSLLKVKELRRKLFPLEGILPGSVWNCMGTCP